MNYTAQSFLPFPPQRSKKELFTCFYLTLPPFPFSKYVLLLFHFSWTSPESDDHRHLKHSAPDLPGESKKITLSPCTPSAEHAAGWAKLGDLAEILISNPTHSPAEHCFFKCYNIARSLVQTSHIEADKIASITFLYTYICSLSRKKKIPPKDQMLLKLKK